MTLILRNCTKRKIWIAKEFNNIAIYEDKPKGESIELNFLDSFPLKHLKRLDILKKLK